MRRGPEGDDEEDLRAPSAPERTLRLQQLLASTSQSQSRGQSATSDVPAGVQLSGHSLHSGGLPAVLLLNQEVDDNSFSARSDSGLTYGTPIKGSGSRRIPGNNEGRDTYGSAQRSRQRSLLGACH